jgi:hypothetical protein
MFEMSVAGLSPVAGAVLGDVMWTSTDEDASLVLLGVSPNALADSDVMVADSAIANAFVTIAVPFRTNGGR